MQWRNIAGGGFTDPGTQPWLPLGDVAVNVEDQRGDPASMLRLARDLIALRRQTPDLSVGSYAAVPVPAGVWSWRRGERHLVVVNCSERDVALDDVQGLVRIGTDRARDGETLRGTLRLLGWEGVVAELVSDSSSPA